MSYIIIGLLIIWVRDLGFMINITGMVTIRFR